MALGADDVRRLALTLVGAEEMDHHGAPSFRVKGKIFCTVRDEPARMMVKLDVEDQHNLCAGHAGVVTPVPGYWGSKGATFVDLTAIDEPFADMLLRLAFTTVAPPVRSKRRPTRR
jgi:hypothetical protein